MLRKFRLGRLVLSLSALLLLWSSGHAASFDCDKATSVTEKAICADEKLSALDGSLSFIWKKVSGIDPSMKTSQLRWLQDRDACGADVSCLTMRYNERLGALIDVQFPVSVDQAGNRLEALVDVEANGSACTADGRFCLYIKEDTNGSSSQMEITDVANLLSRRFDLQDSTNDDDHQPLQLWPRVLRLAGDDAILVGVTYSWIAMYSGGGGNARQLRLFRVSRDGATAVLFIPVDGSLMIRACFSEKDWERRAGACHDEYDFYANLRLDETVKSGLPRLVYRTRATSFPAGASRSKDSRNMRKKDLVTGVDRECTYERVFRFNDKIGEYAPNRPLPDCSDYTAP
ncbi:MAG: hypothetical protein LBV49_00935 [Azonexus sp.]|jgi:uncharacterized protein|nr:hypothetical protein [Azonexus sp.]